MNEITLEILPSKYGDCYLINLNKTHILIDCGFVSTYNKFLKQRLKEINKSGEYLNLVVATHIHSDHIVGLMKLLEENVNSIESKIIPIKEFWFNGFKHIVKTERIARELDGYEKDILKGIVNQGMPTDEDIESETEEIGAEQGLSLTELITNGNYHWNSLLQGKAIIADSVPSIKLTDDISIIILSPTSEVLSELDKFWAKELKNKRSNIEVTLDNLFEKSFEYLLAQEIESFQLREFEDISSSNMNLEQITFSDKFDDSLVNRSSISVIIEYLDKKLLFLGDSHPDVIAKSLEILKSRENYLLNFDLIAVAHHGSAGNIGKELLDQIDSKNFIFSTNGDKHGHPHIETIAGIICREPKIVRKLIFNYPVEIAEQIKNTECRFPFDVKSPIEESIITIPI